MDGSEINVRVLSHTIEFDGEPAKVVAAIDLSDMVRAQQDLKQELARNEKIVEAVISAISRTVEHRDAYTAKHQLSSSQIAAAIAKRLGWDAVRIKHLTWAAKIHDVGNVAVPHEILAKSSCASEVEMKIIRGHVEAGFDIVRDIGLPECIPIAIHQHHERLNGTGYPQGLKGDQIIPEARILAVADVMESMRSHRPYRPAQAMDATLRELESNAGELYDAEIVAIAKALVAEKAIAP